VKDEREAARLYQLAADQGQDRAQFRLAVDYDERIGGLVKDEREALRLFKLAAEQGNEMQKQPCRTVGLNSGLFGPTGERFSTQQE
jgi:TPR repeat protein